MNDEGNAARKIRKLRASRDLWKHRSAEKQQEIRQLRVTVRDLSSSRENWKTRVKELEQQLQAAHEAHAAVGPGSWIFFGGLMDNQSMPRDAPYAHHRVQRLITLVELACVKGLVYPLLLVSFGRDLGLRGRTSYRGIALIFASLRGVVAAVGPCAETIRLWLLRVGLCPPVLALAAPFGLGVGDQDQIGGHALRAATQGPGQVAGQGGVEPAGHAIRQNRLFYAQNKG